jgi:general secretion pathway protein M
MNLRDRIEQLEPRERQLLGIFGLVFVALVLVLLPLGLTALISARQGDNEELRAVIEEIQQSRDAIRKRQAQRDAIVSRYAEPAPPLAPLLARFAAESQIEIPESQDRAIVPHGKKYDERSTKIVLRRVNMLSLVNFMERVAQSNHPLKMSRVNIRKRGTEVDSYDVELILSAWDRKGDKAPKSGAAAGEQADTEDEVDEDSKGQEL